ncbi:MAG: hypothetical protein QOE93_603 [Actinomycetota bacterium]|jgi:hypothetical protein|nr:hypothetical protein [Actinomycetota bacterium]
MYDPIGALRTFQRHNVRYVVIGGYAAGILGAPIMTNDLDICYERSKENMERLASALRELGAKLRVAHVDEELPFILDGLTLAAGDSFTFRTNVGDLDVLATPSGTNGFKDLDAAATTYDLGDGLRARVVSLDDLIRMKEAARRAKDESHLHILQVLKRTIEQMEQPPRE